MTSIIRRLELDATTYPEWRDGILAAEASGAAMPGEPRTYPGYPQWPLDRVRPRRWVSLDRVLAARRSARVLDSIPPPRRVVSQLLQMAHGITGPLSAGPVPSAGGLQSLELYVAVVESSWLPTGVYHYDRSGHFLAQITIVDREAWRQLVPAMDLIEGGSLLWLVVGDVGRVAGKYSDRADRFLLQEAGHLMQNLCLLSTSLGRTTVPLGGYFERAIARRLALPSTDAVLYVGMC